MSATHERHLRRQGGVAPTQVYHPSVYNHSDMHDRNRAEQDVRPGAVAVAGITPPVDESRLTISRGNDEEDYDDRDSISRDSRSIQDEVAFESMPIAAKVVDDGPFVSADLLDEIPFIKSRLCRRLAFVVVTVGILGVVLGVTVRQDSQPDIVVQEIFSRAPTTPIPTLMPSTAASRAPSRFPSAAPSQSASPSALPTATRKAFETQEEVKKAIVAFMRDGYSRQSKVASRYGYNIDNWDVSRVSWSSSSSICLKESDFEDDDFFDDSDPFDGDFNAYMELFNDDISGWDMSRATSFRNFFKGMFDMSKEGVRF